MKNYDQIGVRTHSFADVVVDLDRYCLVKGGESKKITPRAFEVLSYLIEHRDRVVEKQELFEQIWKESFVSDNSLTRAIKEIRHVIGDNADAPRYIETVPKRGYRFIAEITDAPREKAETPDTVLTERREEQTSDPGFRLNHNVAATGNGFGKTAILDWFRHHILAASFTGAIVMALLAAWVYFGVRGTAIDSLAVLPFESGANATNDYLGDGITESLINNLAQLPNLKVISSSSSFSFKGKTIDLREVGQALGVRAVLTGRITQFGDELEINVELSDTRDRSRIWGARYHRKTGEVLSLRSEIAEDVSENLRLRLRGGERSLLSRPETWNNDAYLFYTQGRSYLRQRSAEAIRQAQRFFQQAIDKDPAYALAWSGLSDSYTLLAAQAALPSDEAFAEAMRTAEKAVGLSPDLAEARTSLAHALYHTNDLTRGEREFKRAQQIKPNYPLAHQWYAEMLGETNRWGEALAELERTIDLDPLDLAANAALGWQYLHMRRHEQAIPQFLKTLKLNPNYFWPRDGLALSYLNSGRYAEAAHEFKYVADLTDGNRGLSGLASAYAMAGERDKALQVAARVEELKKRKYVDPMDVAIIYAAIADKDRAFAQLEQALKKREPKFLSRLQENPVFESLRSDNRYEDILGRVGLER